MRRRRPPAPVELRGLAAADAGFHGEMLYAAGFWRENGERPPLEVVLDHPEGRLYHEGWGRPGDAGLVAECGGHPIGAVWYRLFSEEAHGDGFVDEHTPELAIAVRQGHRGLGVGTLLLDAIHERARTDGLTRLSLSVDPDNPARSLYLRHGYIDFEPEDGRGRMIVDLRRPGQAGQKTNLAVALPPWPSLATTVTTPGFGSP